jgi:hypothetical protein
MNVNSKSLNYPTDISYHREKRNVYLIPEINSLCRRSAVDNAE